MRNIRLVYRQSPRGAWCYYGGIYHTTSEKGYSLALADAHKWGFVLPSSMAEEWGCSPRHARRISHTKYGKLGIDCVEVNWYRDDHQVITKRLWLLYPDMIPNDWETAYKRCPRDVEWVGSANEFLAAEADRLGRSDLQ